MNGLLIIGAGGHGKVVAETAEAMGCFTPLAFADDRVAELSGTVRWPVVASTGEAAGLLDSYPSAVIAVGHASTRLDFLRQLAGQGFALPVLRHPSAWISPTARFGDGTVVFAGAVIQADARIGSGVIVNTSASVDHDCVLADGVHVCPGAHLGGNVTVGEGSWLGIGCAVKHGVRIGRGVTVGAGAAVVRDVADGQTVVGCPARPIGGDR